MVSEGIILAAAAAVFLGLWTVFHQYASQYINPTFGAIFVSATAVVLGSIILIPQAKGLELFTNQKGLIFAALAGICAFALDYFAIKTYAAGASVSVAGPIIIGGSVAVASIAGIIFLGESFSLMKIAGISLVILGAGILASL